ncbi:MAG: cupredoxin domain-containing protein [Acidobacteriota bacterium]
MKKLKLWLVLGAVIAVGGGMVALETNVVEAHTRTVRITVDRNGFSPSLIEVEAGHGLNIIFNRTEDANCGRTVVFRRPSIRKALPVGKDVLITLTPREAGRISFTCGMGVSLRKGSIVVSEE